MVSPATLTVLGPVFKAICVKNGAMKGQFMKERGRLVRAFRLDGFVRTRRPRSNPELHELTLGDMAS